MLRSDLRPGKVHGSQTNGETVSPDSTKKKTPQLLGNFKFRGTVLEEKLIPRAPLQDSEPSRAGNAISDVFLVNPLKKHGTREESRGVGGREETFSR